VLVGDSPPKKDDFQPLIAEIHGFKNSNGTFNTVDVAAEEHERFEREFWLKVHREEPPKISPLPEFYQQTRASFKVLANAGGGAMRSLSKDSHINQQVLVLAFGEQWQSQVRRLAEVLPQAAELRKIEGLSTPSNRGEGDHGEKDCSNEARSPWRPRLRFSRNRQPEGVRAAAIRDAQVSSAQGHSGFAPGVARRQGLGRCRSVPRQRRPEQSERQAVHRLRAEVRVLPNYGPQGLSTVSVKLGGAEYDPTSKATTKGAATGKLKYLVFSYTRQGSKWIPLGKPKWESQDLGKLAGEQMTGHQKIGDHNKAIVEKYKEQQQKKKALADALQKKFGSSQ